MTKYSVNNLVAAIALAGAVVAMPIVAAAEETAGPGHGPGHGQGWGPGWGRWFGGDDDGGRGQGQRMFVIIDANDDGRISDDEAAARRESVFLAMDSDDDGELTEEEYMEVRMGTGEGRNEERMKARQEAKRARFAPMDADKSSKVSKAEFIAAGKERFKAADADADGVVTPWEFRSQHQD